MEGGTFFDEESIVVCLEKHLQHWTVDRTYSLDSLSSRFYNRTDKRSISVFVLLRTDAITGGSDFPTASVQILTTIR